MVTLKTMLFGLYDGSDSILKWGKKGVPEYKEFVARFLPKDIREETFIETDKKTGKDKKHNLSNILSGETGGGPAQLSNVFTGKYGSSKIAQDLEYILRSQPAYWQQIRVNCLQAVTEMDAGKCGLKEKRRRLKELLMEYGESTGHIAYCSHLEKWLHMDEQKDEHVDERKENEDLATAYASLIIILMARCCIDEFVLIFKGSVSLAAQYAYMDHPRSMMKRSFAEILKEKDFSPKTEMAYENYAALLSHATRIFCDGKAVEYDHLLDRLYRIIRSEPERKLIRITGPSGAEKNAITQLLYLRLSYDVREGREKNLAPYYMDLGKYFRDGVTTRREAQKCMREDLMHFENFCNDLQPNRIPLLFVDGIKTYSFDGLELDYVLNQLMLEMLPNARYVIAVERGVVMNPHRQRKMPAFASGRYRYEVSMESVYLFDRQNATKYLDKFREIYLPREQGDLYTRLRRLGLDHVDTYQLRVLAPHLREAENICDLYETVCLAYLNGDDSRLDDAAQWAFEFAYTDRELAPILFDLQQLINTHDSFVEYFIARYYLRKLRDGSSEDNVGLLNMVLPKGVTRFIVPMLNSNPAEESRLISLVERSYDEMGVMAKSEMTYWLGRIKAPNLAERAENLLLKQYEFHRKETAAPKSATDLSRKRQLFLLRGICVSLIVKGPTCRCMTHSTLRMIFSRDSAHSTS